MNSSPTGKIRERWWFGGIGQWATLLLCIFLVLLPKGGFKLGFFPITWGYILMGIFTVAALPKSLLMPDRFYLKRDLVFLLVLMFPLQFLLMIQAANGIDNAGLFVASIVGLVINPIMFLVLWRSWYNERTLVALLKLMRICILLAAIYGIFLFFYKLSTGNFIEIPYLTINAADAGELASTKYIDRGGIFKLISTYNNGNVYGVATLILLPLYDKVERRVLFKLLLRVALILTLSRTVWVGILLERLFSMARISLQSLKQFPRIERGLFKNLVGNLALVGVAFGAIFAVTAYGEATNGVFFANFLNDPTLGGRIGDDGSGVNQLTALTDLQIFKMTPVTGFSEMTYFKALADMGLVGFAAILLYFLAPVFLTFYDGLVLQNPIRRAALKGMILYFFMAWVDGAIDYIPVMAFYWIAAIFLIYWPQDRMTVRGEAIA
jgi:hypothetical protein